MDYMLASQDLYLAMHAASINKEVIMATHDAVDFTVKAKADWPEVTVLAETTKLPSAKPLGPVRPRT